MCKPDSSMELPADFRDPASAANLTRFAIPHYEFVLAVDFASRRLRGAVDLTVARVGAHTDTHVVLDVHMLDVAAVVARSAGDAPCKFEVKPFAAFGSALHIDLSELPLASTYILRVYYVAGAGPAFCWLNPEQTAGKVHPFVFTQGQACLNRSLVPCMDGPSARSKWTGSLLVPAPFRAVLSAVMDDAEGKPASAEAKKWNDWLTMPSGGAADVAAAFAPVDFACYRVFTAVMRHSVPSYLVALAVGDLAAADVGPRSRVWTEPVQLERAKHEFGHRNVTEEYVATGERLFGPYQWGRYDIVVMPPSFPYGGMENPNATFVTPALLAGDQSLTDVIAHEIAHSWTGNLVTNASWTQFFLNEGFTMFLQRRITEEVDGVAATALETVAGRALLRRAMVDYAHSNSLTRLVVPLEEGIDPDETYTETPYEKGFAFVSYLRACVGSAADFDAWIKTYTTRFSFKSISAVDMLTSFFEAFPHLKGDWTPERWLLEEKEEAPTYWRLETPTPDADDLDRFGTLPGLDLAAADAKGRRGLAYRAGYEFMRWFHAPGWPVFYPGLEAAKQLSAPAEQLAHAWLHGASGVALPVDAATFSTWPTIQRLHFLDTILARAEKDAATLPASSSTVTHALLQRLDAVHGFGTSGNAEVRLRWSQLVATAVWEAGLPSVHDFLQSTGKLKYVTPVFRALVGARVDATGGHPMREFAKKAHAAFRASWHAAVQSRVDGVMKDAGLL